MEHTVALSSLIFLHGHIFRRIGLCPILNLSPFIAGIFGIFLVKMSENRWKNSKLKKFIIIYW